MNTANVIKAARERAGLSKRALARRAATSPAAIVAYEGGSRDPSTRTFERLLGAMGARPEVTIVVSSRPYDPAQAGARLVQVLELAEHLPSSRRRRPLRYPRFPEC